MHSVFGRFSQCVSTLSSMPIYLHVSFNSTKVSRVFHPFYACHEFVIFFVRHPIVCIHAVLFGHMNRRATTTKQQTKVKYTNFSCVHKTDDMVFVISFLFFTRKLKQKLFATRRLVLLLSSLPAPQCCLSYSFFDCSSKLNGTKDKSLSLNEYMDLTAFLSSAWI